MRLTYPLRAFLCLASVCPIAVAQKPDLVVQSGHSDTVVGLAFSPDGKILASGGSDNTVKLWEVSSGKELHSLSGMRGGSYVAFSEDGRFLATGGDDQVLRLWDKTSWRMIASAATGSMIRVVAFSPNDKILATGNVDKEVHLWSVPSCASLGALGENDEIKSLALSRDGKTHVSGSADNLITVWNLETRTSHTLGESKSNGWVTEIALSPDGRTILGNDLEGVIIWQVDSGAGHRIPGERNALAFNPDATRAAFYEIRVFRSSIARPTDTPVYASADASRRRP